MQFTYRVERVLDRWPNRAQRAAVLRPELDLRQPAFTGPPAPRTVEREMKRLRKIWRKRLRELATLGWLPLQNKRNFEYAANCAPFGMKLRRLTHQERQDSPELVVPTRFCRQRKLCPFCWGRLVEDCYERFHFALFGQVTAARQPDPMTGKKRYPSPKRGDLLELQYVHRFDRREFENCLEPVLDLVRTWRPELARRFDPWAGIVLSTFEPDEVTYWRVTTRALFLTACGKAYRRNVGAELGGQGSVVFKSVPYHNHGKIRLSRPVLAQAVARTWEYPWRLLDPKVDAQLVSHLVNQMRNFKSYFYYGELRNKSERVRRGIAAGSREKSQLDGEPASGQGRAQATPALPSPAAGPATRRALLALEQSSECEENSADLPCRRRRLPRPRRL